jgi:phosphoribosylanthranilate isomerase
VGKVKKMIKTAVKICGLKRVNDIRLCYELGVDMVGFVTEYPLPVPWNLTPEETKTLLEEVQAPVKSCIVTGGTCDKIIALAESLRPDYIQLHYNETLVDTNYIVRALRPLHIGVIKTLPLSPYERLAQFGTADIQDCIELLNSTGIFAILADTRAPSNAAGNGIPVDVVLYRQIKRCAQKPVILAGGIKPENLTQLLSRAQPDIIDIMTGVENSPGVKDREKLAFIIKHIR